MRRLRSWVALASTALAPIACEAPVPEVHPIAAAPDLPVHDVRDRAVSTLADMGYAVIEIPGAPDRIATEWRYDRGLLSLSRHRVLIRLSSDGQVWIAVPREVQAGGRFVLDGEDEDVARRVRGRLVARLHPPSERPPPPDRDPDG